MAWFIKNAINFFSRRSGASHTWNDETATWNDPVVTWNSLGSDWYENDDVSWYERN